MDLTANGSLPTNTLILATDCALKNLIGSTVKVQVSDKLISKKRAVFLFHLLPQKQNVLV